MKIRKDISEFNYSKINNIKFLVIHDTGNKNDSAAGNANYFGGGNR